MVWCLKKLCFTRKSFLPSYQSPGTLSPLHGLGLPSAQSRSTANNENFKINTGKSWCWDGAAVDFKFILNKEENNRKSVKFMRGWDFISRSLDNAVKMLDLTSVVEKGFFFALKTMY